MKTKYEVKAIHCVRYYATVEADTAEEAREIADTHNLIDESFWHEDYDSWDWRIFEVMEIEDDEEYGSM